MTTDQIGYILYRQDLDDCNRITHREVGLYRSKVKADQVADEHNARLTAKLIAAVHADYRQELQAVAEHNALFDAGFRNKRRTVPELPEALKEGWVPGEWDRDGFMSVEPIDWDDQP